jgi:hypothetical protein
MGPFEESTNEAFKNCKCGVIFGRVSRIFERCLPKKGLVVFVQDRTAAPANWPPSVLPPH